MGSSGRPQDVWKSSTPARPVVRGRAPARGKWFAAALAVVALGGVIAGLLFYLWPDPAPVVLAIPVSAYDNPDWPPNPWVEADARGLVERATEGGIQTFQAQEKAAILRELDRVVGEAGRRPLVVYLAALGVVANGKVHLVPGDARPDEPASLLPLDEVLTRLRRARSPRLLVLDIRPALDPRIALAGEDVNERLDAALAALADSGELPFLVLIANAPPTGAGVLRAFKRTAFGLALGHGAGGAADGWNAERSRDGRVSARELAAYAREVTHYIATTAGLPAQTPRLHGTGGDFDIFAIPQSGAAPLPSPAELEREPEWLQQAWKDRDEWLKEGVHLRAPRLFRHFSLTAARAERRWLAGGSPEAILATFNVAASRLREIRPRVGAIVQPVETVARAQRKAGVNVAAAAQALQPVFNRLAEPAGKESDKALADAVKAVWDKPPEGEPFDGVAAAVFNGARTIRKPTHRDMKELAALVRGLRPRPPRHAELAPIVLIGGLPPERVDRWPAGTIELILTVTRDAEEAVAVDGRCLPWARQTIARADASRRNALRDLCNPKSTSAVRERAVAELDAVGKEYRTVRTAAVALASAFREYEETRAVLVELAVAYPFDALPLSEELGRTWEALADDFGRLQKALRAPAGSLPNPAELERTARSVLAGRESLRRALGMGDSASIRQYENLLCWPHWSKAERDQLLERLAKADRGAAERVLAGWPKEPPNRETPVPDRGAASTRGGLARSIALLRLVEAPDAGELKAELDRLGPSPTAGAMADLAARVRHASRRKLAEAYASADPARQAFTGWAVDLEDAPAFAQPGSAGPPNPEYPERRAAEKAFHDWLAKERYGAEAAFYRSLEVPAAGEAANDLGDIARAYADAFR
jgi:hypothetical protein